MDVLGICAFDRPSAACLVRDGRVLAAVREDVLSSRLDDRAFPSHAVEYCLRAGKVGATALAAVGVAGTLETRMPEAYRGAVGSVSSFSARLRRWLGGGTATLRDLLREELGADLPVVEVGAALAEATAALQSAPLPAPPPSAPQSAGLTDAVVLVIDDAALETFAVRERGLECLGRAAASPVLDVGGAAAALRAATGATALCVGGPGALDRSRNASLRHAGFEHVWVSPVAGSGGAAAGAALLAWQRGSGAERVAVSSGDARLSAALGPAYNAAQVRTFLRSQGSLLPELGRDEAAALAARLLAEGRRVGWVDGRLELGEDTAGSRSILRALSPDAPLDAAAGETVAVPAERAAEVFEVDPPCSPFLELAVRPTFRAALGESGGADRRWPVSPIGPEHRGMRALLAAFERSTGMPFVAAKPLRASGGWAACTLGDAWAARAHAALDALVLGSYVVSERPLTEGGAGQEIVEMAPKTPRSP